MTSHRIFLKLEYSVLNLSICVTMTKFEWKWKVIFSDIKKTFKSVRKADRSKLVGPGYNILRLMKFMYKVYCTTDCCNVVKKIDRLIS